jgi:hypothetical protein
MGRRADGSPLGISAITKAGDAIAASGDHVGIRTGELRAARPPSTPPTEIQPFR